MTSGPPVAELRNKAEAGDAESQFVLGGLYDRGRGVPGDKKEAARWFRAAAEKGHPDAQNNLGSFYQFGEGVPQDCKVAREWYEKAVAGGSADALNSLGYLYNNGLGVETNRQRAIELYLQATEKRHPHAMYNLGISYQTGDGVPKDLVEAYKWFDLARFHTQFSPDMQVKWGSRGSLDEVKRQLRPEQIKEAGQRARDWDRQRRPK
ncbi:MAG TPA: tetratricopeptide repeat protein [Methylomirabilota bacterium]|nr:tetratricopeptide repeat protein [Methylomirabilota bacterium]